jgi:DNA gyrase/topoisomerase IV subunit A
MAKETGKKQQFNIQQEETCPPDNLERIYLQRIKKLEEESSKREEESLKREEESLKREAESSKRIKKLIKRKA